MFSKILAFLTGKNIGLAIVALVVALATLQIVTWLKIRPMAKKHEKAMDEKTDSLNTAVIFAEQQKGLVINLQQGASVMRDSLITLNTEVDAAIVNHEAIKRQYQNTIKLLTAEADADDALIKSLETGVRVDVVTITKNVFGKVKDSTYVKGARWGE